jgi:hypothetical protein
MIYAIILYLLLVSVVHAKLEIMVEGDESGGWARKLPCWRFNVFITKLLIGKEISGYHFYLCLLFFLLFHNIFLFVPWTMNLEFFVLGSFFWYWVFEDFFWFVLNKHYGICKFRKGKILWHIRWFWGLPVSYWISGILGTLFLILGGLK